MTGMPQHLHRGAASMHRKDTLNASWEDLHAFLLCTRHQSFRNAAEVLGLTGTTLMRKIDRLEEGLGFKVFLRDQSGLSMSDEGRALLFDVEQMARLSFYIFRRASLSENPTEGTWRTFQARRGSRRIAPGGRYFDPARATDKSGPHCYEARK